MFFCWCRNSNLDSIRNAANYEAFMGRPCLIASANINNTDDPKDVFTQGLLAPLLNSCQRSSIYLLIFSERKQVGGMIVRSCGLIISFSAQHRPQNSMTHLGNTAPGTERADGTIEMQRCRPRSGNLLAQKPRSIGRADRRHGSRNSDTGQSQTIIAAWKLSLDVCAKCERDYGTLTSQSAERFVGLSLGP